MVAKAPGGKRVSRTLGVVSAVQWPSSFALAIFLPQRQQEWFVPLVIAVVGVHFVPLASVLRYRPDLDTAMALVAFAALYPLWAPAGPASPVGLLGAGAVLWVTALGQLTVEPSNEAAAADTLAPGARLPRDATP
jgi:hypothetical protein